MHDSRIKAAIDNAPAAWIKGALAVETHDNAKNVLIAARDLAKCKKPQGGKTMVKALVAAIKPGLSPKQVYDLPESNLIKLALKCHIRRARELPPPEQSKIPPIPNQVNLNAD